MMRVFYASKLRNSNKESPLNSNIDDLSTNLYIEKDQFILNGTMTTYDLKFENSLTSLSWIPSCLGN